LYGMEQDNEIVPEPSTIKNAELDENERAVFIEASMPVFRPSRGF